MTPIRTDITTLPRGHEFPKVTFVVGEGDVAAYLGAVGDRGSYGDAVPPLAAVALALRELQSWLTLPDGALHTSQEVEHERVVRAGEPLMLGGRVAQRSVRQGMVISVLEYELLASEGVAIRARTTIMAPEMSE